MVGAQSDLEQATHAARLVASPAWEAHNHGNVVVLVVVGERVKWPDDDFGVPWGAAALDGFCATLGVVGVTGSDGWGGRVGGWCRAAVAVEFIASELNTVPCQGTYESIL